MEPRSLERLQELFWEQIREGLHPGAALAVYRYGKPVLDLYGGVADTGTGRRVTADTLFVLFSSTKPLASACLYILKDCGKLDWNDKVSRYWPEFSQNGKATVTIRHVLTHKAGFPETPVELKPENWRNWSNWDVVVSAMEHASPRWKPGTVLAYHSFNVGWVVGELVRRVDGRPFSRFLREELTEPLGMKNTYVGLSPALEDRVSKIYMMSDPGAYDDSESLVSAFNRPEVHQAVIPAGGGISTARDMARFYAMMERGGTLDGVQVLKPQTVAEVTKLRVRGMDRIAKKEQHLTIGMRVAEPRMGSLGSKGTRRFGHGGAGLTSSCWADPELGLAVALVSNGFYDRDYQDRVSKPGGEDPRLAALSQAAVSACL